MTAIYKRELKTFFTTVTGWLFIAAHICLAGLYFFAINLLSGYSNVGQSFSSILFLLLLSTPILSMRVLAEERKQKTDQLILTSPVSIGGIVAGKYLAMATVFTIPVAVMALFPLILSRYGTVSMGESYTVLLAYYLFGLTCLAIGLFISSITESQVIAAVLSFALLFVGYMMSSITGLISQTGNLLTKILNAYNFTDRLDAMVEGTLNLKSVLYFVTLIVVFLFLTVQSIQKRRYQVSVKTLQIGVEEGEEFQQTALREVLEESGSRASIIKYVGKSEYTFNVPEDVVEKEVHWYLMMADSYYSKPQREEYFVDSGFYKYHEAYHLLKFANEKQILEKAYHEYLELKKSNLWGSHKYY